MIDLVKSEEFGFWVPMDLCKADSVRGANGRKRWIEGIASTPHKDLQKEVVEQVGIDFSYFLEFGYYNNDHKPGFENKVGEPIEARITAEGFWTKGFLYENHKVSDAVWELAHALESSQSRRKLGFSIQGKVLKRYGHKIIKCWVQDVAITAAPINTHTWLDIVKSINAVPADMWCGDPNYEITSTVVSKSINKVACTGSCGRGCKCSISEIPMDLQKDGENERKALSTATAGGALIPESLERDKKDQGYAYKSLMGFDDCVHLLRDQRGLSRSEATVLTEAVFEMNGIIN